MSNTSNVHAEASLTVVAPASTVYDLILDVAHWPRMIGHGLHAARLDSSETEDLVEYWALAGPDAVRTWRSRRVFDAVGLRIAFTHEQPEPPIGSGWGEWLLRESSSGETLVTLRHGFTVDTGDPELPERMRQGITRNTGIQLQALKAYAEATGDRVVEWEESLFLAGPIEPVYEFFHDADRWPDRVPRVTAVRSREQESDIQFLSVDMAGSSVRTVGSVRLCLPGDRIVYRLLDPVAPVISHTGSWVFESTAAGTTVIGSQRAVVDGTDPAFEASGGPVRRLLAECGQTFLHCVRDFAATRADAAF
ncbi:aromatase/cyclase [Nocardia arthritidis]|uniref:aromatase/cyclase n=1 Tax=Nocardia arthritidis TaxID=228602 RepID=UPI00142D4CAE|nr:SRPBCC family protein [Nocardia arthritidis]